MTYQVTTIWKLLRMMSISFPLLTRSNALLFLGSGYRRTLSRGRASTHSNCLLGGLARCELIPATKVHDIYFPRSGRRRKLSLGMIELYRNEAEAEFYADRLRDLITVYAMKTAYSYWMELRGNMYAEWLARYIQDHGGVETVGWHAFLSGMLRAPPEDIIVKKLIKKPRGGSGDNPYLADRKPVQYTETIEPVSIARRMMNIREQVADLLGNDLRRMAAENAKLRQDYVREAELGPDRALTMQLSDLEILREVNPSTGMDNPPQRCAAYKSALELVTSASIQRVKAELRIRGDQHTLDWLERFSKVSLEQRGNKLIKALFEGPMILINDRDRARPKVIEPLRVAHIIMKGREIVAEELIDVLAQVPKDHAKLTVSLLNEQWHSAGDPDP